MFVEFGGFIIRCLVFLVDLFKSVRIGNSTFLHYLVAIGCLGILITFLISSLRPKV